MYYILYIQCTYGWFGASYSFITLFFSLLAKYIKDPTVYYIRFSCLPCQFCVNFILLHNKADWPTGFNNHVFWKQLRCIEAKCQFCILNYSGNKINKAWIQISRQMGQLQATTKPQKIAWKSALQGRYYSQEIIKKLHLHFLLHVGKLLSNGLQSREFWNFGVFIHYNSVRLL